MTDVTKFEVDILIIGAGISGIYAAKLYLDLHPEAKLVILDRDNCVGGTWNSRRGYDTFWTQWTVGTAEFSDEPMPRPPEEDIYMEFFKAKHTTKYLETYVDSHCYAGKTLRDKVRFSMEVKSVEKINKIWTVQAQGRGADGLQQTFTTPRLIVASGLTSIPNMPYLKGSENFGGRILHHDAFGSSDVLTSPDVKRIVILGAGKSSADMAYEAVKAGKTVSWVIKATETTGPGFFLSPAGKGPYKNAFEIGMTRAAGSFTPSFMNGVNWWTKLLHSSTYGPKLMNSFWGAVDGDARKEAHFTRECLQGFDKLEPHSQIFWQNCTGGLLNHTDFFEVIAEHVRIYAGDIKSLDQNGLHLKTGEDIRCDVVLCGTGWVPSLQFFTQSQCEDLGLPHMNLHDSQWADIEKKADAKVLATFPQLDSPPEMYIKPATHTPYRLYRNIAPLSESSTIEDRSIVFVGQVGVGNYFPTVECQMLWAMAYLDGKLDLPSKEAQEDEVALFTTWCKRRYLSNGIEGNNMTFELIGYTDTLLKDLGLKSHRKGWFKDLFSPLWARDLAGLKPEFMEKYGYGYEESSGQK
ncbi:hypothetical protein HYFRA_00009022 [Hymenoscyphus fraxineus]|uniref:Uncharacterized protein n=1 Tax=Hymenoscyphus fraxineus TaxID=746836 RepID=A0A9N9PSS5_9HELO|nr:hypothetical protein HYFRA_00009022 [Hymenoscyphus fraxineus]